MRCPAGCGPFGRGRRAGSYVYGGDNVENELTFPAYSAALAFLLEVVALASYGFWAWRTVSGPLRVPVTVGLPVGVALLWGVFATAGAQASGRTVVETPGPARLLLELAVLGGAVLVLYRVRARVPALVVTVLLLVHLATTYHRLQWLATH